MATEKNQEVAVVEKTNSAKKRSDRKSRALQKQKPQAVAVPVTRNDLMMQAVKQKDVSIILEMIALQKEIDAMEAEKAFNLAMSGFRNDCPVIQKKVDGATNSEGDKVLWKYAPLGHIAEAIRVPLSSHGLSYSWDSQDEMRADRPVKKTICTITHVLGHSRSSTFTSAIDAGTGAMNAIQKEQSTVEYGRRQSLKLALGIVVEDEDDDAVSAMNGKSVETITKAQTKLIENQIGSTDETLYKAILTAYEVAELHQIPADKLDDCKKRITDYKKAKREREKKAAKGTQTNMEIAT